MKQQMHMNGQIKGVLDYWDNLHSFHKPNVHLCTFDSMHKQINIGGKRWIGKCLITSKNQFSVAKATLEVQMSVRSFVRHQNPQIA